MCPNMKREIDPYFTGKKRSYQLNRIKEKKKNQEITTQSVEADKYLKEKISSCLKVNREIDADDVDVIVVGGVVVLEGSTNCFDRCKIMNIVEKIPEVSAVYNHLKIK